ncbi:hypothetical protein PENTCL1PPCAC_20868, partial [Pristionchus entomophagus]
DVHFVREYQMVKGVIGGIEVEACLDTGADVNLIDKSTVDRMNGVVLDTSKSYRIKDAGGNTIKTVGRTVLEVEMNVGKKCRVGFIVAEHCDAILLGAVALEAMGMELRLKEESREEAVESPDNATVLRTVYVAPGRPGEGPKVLISEREDIVEGTNEKALIVRVPVWNSTESDIVFEKHDIVGVWKKVQGLNRDKVGIVVNAVTRSKTAASRWDEEEKRRKEREDIEESDNVNQWRIDQSKDEWVVKMIGWLSEVEEKKRDIGEEVTIPGSTKRTCLADWVVHRGILYLLSIDHEKRLYVPEGRREKFIEEIHNSPLSGHLCTRKMVQKLSSEVFWGSMHRDVQTVLKRYTVDMDVDQYKRRMSWMMEKTRSVVITKLEAERKKMKEKYDTKNANNMKIQPKKGDRVYIRVEPKPGDIRKMVAQFDGPFRVEGTSNTTVTVERIDSGLDGNRGRDRRVVQWDRVRLVPKENEHPDHVCEEEGCGHRTAREVIPEMGKVRAAGAKFCTLRQLGALFDLKEEWNMLSVSQAMRMMGEMADKKIVSSQSLKKAYDTGLCEHLVDDMIKVEKTGVSIEGEEGKISDALSEILMRNGGRQTRKSMMALIPADSPVATASGVWKELETLEYKDDKECRAIMRGMHEASSLPKALVIVLKNSFSKDVLEKIRKMCEQVADKTDVALYVIADLLPSKPSDFHLDANRNIQCFLHEWRMKKPLPNLIVISPISGLIWGCAFTSLFVIARKEKRELFEGAVMFLLDGIPLPLESIT